MRQLFALQKFRRVALQSVFAVAIILLIVLLIVTGQRIIADQGIATGFGFLKRTTGWPMNFSVIEVTGRSTCARVLWAGLLNTLLVGFLTLIFATLLGLLPSLTNQYIWLMKGTTVGIAIGYPDYFAIVSTSINQSGQTMELLALLMGGFIVINYSIGFVMNAINERIKLKGRN